MEDAFSSYKSVETTVLTAVTNQEVNVTTTAGTSLRKAEKVVIRTDQTITVRFNSTSNDAITIGSTEGSLTMEDLLIHSLFISNASGSTANVKIVFLGVLKSSL